MDERAAHRKLAFLFRKIAEVYASLGTETPQPLPDPKASPSASTPPGDVEPEAPAASPVAVSTEAIDGRELVIASLQCHGISVKNVHDLGPEQEGLALLARLIAKKHDNLGPLLLGIKRSLPGHSAFTLNLRDRPDTMIADITLIANLLDKAGLLNSYHYQRSPARLLHCFPARTSLAYWFLTGGWLEVYVEEVVNNVLRTRASADSSGALFRVTVELSGEEQFELDAVAVVDGTFLWIEAKTTMDFTTQLARYRRISSLLCDRPDSAILVSSACSSEDTLLRVKASQAGMQLCGLEDFEPCLRGLVDRLRAPLDG